MTANLTTDRALDTARRWCGLDFSGFHLTAQQAVSNALKAAADLARNEGKAAAA